MRYSKEFKRNVRGKAAEKVKDKLTLLVNITNNDRIATELLTPTEIKEGIVGLTRSFVRGYTGITQHSLECLYKGEDHNHTLDTLRRASFFLREYQA